jgi:hypothetical protein
VIVVATISQHIVLLFMNQPNEPLNSVLMATSMLEYSKMILENVSFDAALFRKELMKAVQRLVEPEQEALLTWCMARYQYP